MSIAHDRERQRPNDVRLAVLLLAGDLGLDLKQVFPWRQAAQLEPLAILELRRFRIAGRREQRATGVVTTAPDCDRMRLVTGIVGSASLRLS